MRSWALALTLGALGRPALAAERRYALTIGANRGAAGDQPLRYAEDDAHRVAEIFEELGDVAPVDLVQVSAPTADEVRRALAGLERRLQAERAAGDRTLLVVYYAGHADAAALHLGDTRLPMDELMRLLRGMSADLRVIVLDTCEVGQWARTRGGKQVPAFDLHADVALDTEGTAIITSSAAGEAAQESDLLRGGVFTHHLVSGLSGAADANSDGRVTLDEAYRYAYARTLATTSRAASVQHPSYAFDLAGRADVALTSLRAPGGDALLALAEAGSWLVLDARQPRLVAELNLDGPRTLALPAGQYRVVHRLPSRVYEGTFEALSGQTRRVSTADLELQPYGQAVRRGGGTGGRAALGLMAGGGISTSILPDLSAAPSIALGARAELPWLSILLRAEASRADGENEFLSMHVEMGGGQITALRLWDLGPASLGGGLGGGASGVWQSFQTTGDAPARFGYVGVVYPAFRAEIALNPRISLGLDGELDSWVYRGLDPRDQSVETRWTVTPGAHLDATFWLR